MNFQIALPVTPVEETIVNVDIRIADFLQALGNHGIGLFLD